MTALIMGGIKMNEEIKHKELKEEILQIKLEKSYIYQPELTPELDKSSKDKKKSIDQNFLNEVVLWKVNRYAKFSDDVIAGLNQLKRLNNETTDNELFKKVLAQLLSIKGVQLPMASTILRFTKPERFAIYDQRVGRLIEKENEVGSISDSLSETKKEEKINQTIEFYQDYLLTLKTICKELDIKFSEADRILYLADKKFNGKLEKY